MTGRVGKYIKHDSMWHVEVRCIFFCPDPMGKNPLVSDFSSLTRHVGGNILAVGSLKMKRSLKDSIIGMLISSVFGTILKTIFKKDPLHYLLLSDNALHHITVLEGQLQKREDFPLSELSAKSAADQNNTLWHLSFTHKGQPYSFDVFRYLLQDEDGSYTSDTEYMKKVDTMTGMFVQALKA